MDQFQIQLETVLGELKEQIIQFFEQDMLDVANTLMEQYAKLAPNYSERYSLEAMLRVGEGNLEGAETILKEGVKDHPLNFDLLYNWGYVYEQKEAILESYQLYMKARYVAEQPDEKSDVAEALKRLVPKMAGSVASEGGKVSTILKAGQITMKVTSEMDDLLKRKELLRAIESKIDRDSTTVLEIGFLDGIISKNLNYFGYEVTGVDPVNQNVLNVIAREWHDNLLGAEQDVAKFYSEPINLEWVERTPEFDVVIAVNSNNRKTFACEGDDQGDIIAALLHKAQKQLIMRVASEQSETEFVKADLARLVEQHGYELEVIYIGHNKDGEKFEVCLVNKDSNIKPFSVPKGAGIVGSKSTIFEVELSKCLDLYGSGYLNDAHHFTEVLKQYQGNNELEYSDSVLKTYYDQFQPRNLEEALFIEKGRAPMLSKGWIGYPWLWNKKMKVIFNKEHSETRPGGIHHFGPNTDDFGAGELKRLIPLYKIFKEQGYQPELFFDGYISGHFLIKGDDYRFIVTEGQHRVACLAALGYETIRCRFSSEPQYPKVILWQDVKKWPQVANGVYSRNLALRIFERFFVGGIGKERMGI